MAYRIRLLKAAEDDFNEIVSYIAVDDRAAAIRVAEKIEAKLSHLSRYPLIGRIPNEEELIRLGYRFLVVDHYLIFYTLAAKTILIHRIIHGAQDYLRLL